MDRCCGRGHGNRGGRGGGDCGSHGRGGGRGGRRGHDWYGAGGDMDFVALSRAAGETSISNRGRARVEGRGGAGNRGSRGRGGGRGGCGGHDSYGGAGGGGGRGDMDFAALSRAAGDMSISDRGTGGGRGRGEGCGSRGRGARGGRGKHENRPTNYDVVSTRPASLEKKGSTGSPVALITNYIGIKKKPDSTLFKYRVDFRSKVSDELETWIKKTLFSRLKPQLPAYLFDGTMCYIPLKIENLKYNVTFEGCGGAKDNHVEIELRLINELRPSDNDYVHVSNTTQFT